MCIVYLETQMMCIVYLETQNDTVWMNRIWMQCRSLPLSRKRHHTHMQYPFMSISQQSQPMSPITPTSTMAARLICCRPSCKGFVLCLNHRLLHRALPAPATNSSSNEKAISRRMCMHADDASLHDMPPNDVPPTTILDSRHTPCRTFLKVVSLHNPICRNSTDPCAHQLHKLRPRYQHLSPLQFSSNLPSFMGTQESQWTSRRISYPNPTLTHPKSPS